MKRKAHNHQCYKVRTKYNSSDNLASLSCSVITFSTWGPVDTYYGAINKSMSLPPSQGGPNLPGVSG